jgi:hypothetical protein
MDYLTKKDRSIMQGADFELTRLQRQRRDFLNWHAMDEKLSNVPFGVFVLAAFLIVFLGVI